MQLIYVLITITYFLKIVRSLLQIKTITFLSILKIISDGLKLIGFSLIFAVSTKITMNPMDAFLLHKVWLIAAITMIVVEAMEFRGIEVKWKHSKLEMKILHNQIN